MCVFVANGTPPAPALLHNLTRAGGKLIAVDGGLAAIDQAGLEPTLILGDLDSAPTELLDKYAHIPQVFTPDESKSDLEKALEYVAGLQLDTLQVCGALGRRIDHTLTNICLLCRYPVKMKFESNEEQCFALLPSNRLGCEVGQTLSLIPISTHVRGVTTQGLKWNLKNATLDKNFVSISNQCLQKHVEITFEEGDLLVTLNRCEPFSQSAS